MTTSKDSELLNGAQEFSTHTFCSLYTFSVDAVRQIPIRFVIPSLITHADRGDIQIFYVCIN